MSITPENLDQEVRIRLLEKLIQKIEQRFDHIDEKFNCVDEKFDKIEAKMESQFHWVLGLIITMILTTITLFGGVILHLAKLI